MNTIAPPKIIKPVLFAAQQKQITASLALLECERLISILRDTEGSIDFSLQFMQDDEHRAIVRARIQADLVLECRRCLKSMSYPMDLNVDLAVVANDDEAEALPDCYEPLIVIDEEVSLVSLIEDELLLNLPVLANHSEADCSLSLPAELLESNEVRKNPFAVLKNYKPSS